VPDWRPTPPLRAADWCRPYWRRFVPFACALLYAAERCARRIRPACLPPRPLAGCRRKQSSIDGDPSFSIHLSLCSTGFHRLPRSYEEIRLLHGRRPVVVASFRPTARIPSLTRGGVPFADPCRPPRVRTLDVLPLPAPIPLRSRLDFGRRVPWHAHPIGPACTGLHLRSVLQRASGFFPTRPHGARPDCLATPPPACSCLRLAVASNLLRRGLAPPIQGPCLAHQGCSQRSHRLRRLKPLTPSFSPASHSAMPSMPSCCSSELKRRVD
jgi:hypothetical protein